MPDVIKSSQALTRRRSLSRPKSNECSRLTRSLAQPQHSMVVYDRFGQPYQWNHGEFIAQNVSSAKILRESNDSFFFAFTNTIRSVLSHVFVPSGRLSPEYSAFQLADSIQGTCSYLRGILSMAATLQGAGFENNAATGVLAAVFTFILKDGTGMLGSLIFSYFCAGLFDYEVKFWRLFADCINDVGLTLELLAPYCGPYFVVVTTLANVCKSLCGVAAGATRVAIAQHFAVDGNVAEVQAKEGAQETAVTLSGLLLGLLLSSWLNSSEEIKWISFTILTVIHVVANYMGVRMLRLRSLTPTRVHLQILSYVHNNKRLLSAADMCNVEPIIPVHWLSYLGFGKVCRVQFVDIQDLTRDSGKNSLVWVSVSSKGVVVPFDSGAKLLESAPKDTTLAVVKRNDSHVWISHLQRKADETMPGLIHLTLRVFAELLATQTSADVTSVSENCVDLVNKLRQSRWLVNYGVGEQTTVRIDRGNANT